MIVIYGDTECLCLEENLERFFEILDWSRNHKCVLKNKRKVAIDISESGVIIQNDVELDMDLPICSVNEFYAICKTCGNKARSSYDYKD